MSTDIIWQVVHNNLAHFLWDELFCRREPSTALVPCLISHGLHTPFVFIFPFSQWAQRLTGGGLPTTPSSPPFHSTYQIQIIISPIKISLWARNHHKWQWWMAGEKQYYQTAKKIVYMNKRKRTQVTVLRHPAFPRADARLSSRLGFGKIDTVVMKRWQDKHPHAGLILIFSWQRIQRWHDWACHEIQPDQLQINPTVFVSLLVRCHRLLSATCPIRMDQVTADAWKRHIATHQDQDHLEPTTFRTFQKWQQRVKVRVHARIQDSLIQNWFITFIYSILLLFLRTAHCSNTLRMWTISEDKKPKGFFSWWSSDKTGWNIKNNSTTADSTINHK